MPEGKREQLQSEIRSLGSAGRELVQRAAKAVQTNKSVRNEIRFDYQGWLSTAMPVVEQILPDRYAEFCALYLPPKRTKLDLTTYALSDLFLGLRPVGVTQKDVDWIGLELLMRQYHLVESADKRLESALANIRGTLQAELFDEELDAAHHLSKRGHLRAAGAVAGVVLERHLQMVATSHRIDIRKRNPTIADLNEPLKERAVYDIPVWRCIQHLSDLRNLCVHQKDRNPTKDELEELIGGVMRIVKTVY